MAPQESDNLKTINLVANASWCCLLLSKSRPHVTWQIEEKMRTSDFIQNEKNRAQKNPRCSSSFGALYHPRLHAKHALGSKISYHTKLADTNVWIFPSKLRPMQRIAQCVDLFIICLPSTPTCLFLLKTHMQTCSCGIFKVPTFLFQTQNLCMSVLGLKSCRDTLTLSNFRSLSLSGKWLW